MKPQSVDHIVLIVKDIKETERFYSSFLGEPDHSDSDSIAYTVGETKIFFGATQVEFEKIDKDKGGLNHLAFGVRTPEELREFEKVLNATNTENSGVKIDQYGNKEFVWFNDPNGYRIEFYCRN